MKKSLFLTNLLAIGATSAMANIYIGVDYGANANTQKESGYFTASRLNKYSDFSFKIGGGADGDWKSQFRISSISYDKPIFDTTHKTLIEFGDDVIKEFTIDSVKNLYPYVKVGLGSGSMSVDGFDKSSIAEVSFNAGVGVSYKTIDHLYIIGGVDYIGRKWQNIQADLAGHTLTVTVTDGGMQSYIGVNYAF